MNPNFSFRREVQSDYDYEDMSFIDMVMEESWEQVIAAYERDRTFHNKAIQGRGTALHVAITFGNPKVVENLVKAIINHGHESSLRLTNEKGATPLHLAAYRGFTNMCEIIIGEKYERSDLVKIEDTNGETPLFWAVRAGRSLVFIYLQQFFPYDINLVINNNHTTILHIAIERENFDLAMIIKQCYDNLSYMRDKDQVAPLEILATKTSAFKSGSRLLWWQRILYYCFSISTQDARTTLRLYRRRAVSKGTVVINGIGEIDDDYRNKELPLQVEDLEKTYKKPIALSRLDFFSRVKILWQLFQKFVFSLPILSQLDFWTIKNIKKKHIYGGKLLEKFMMNPYDSYRGGGGCKTEHDEFEYLIRPSRETSDTLIQKTKENKKMEDSANIGEKDATFAAVAKSGVAEITEEVKSKVPVTSDKNIKLEEDKDVVNETAYLIAARNGIYEMMEELQSEIKSVVHETNSNNENALLLAVKNRHPRVVQWLHKNLRPEIFYHINLEIDKNWNTMLHLAAITSTHRENTWWISGSAMQMMWDIKWYKYIQGLVPQNFSHRRNKQGQTPSEIFMEKHEELHEKSLNWLKDTSESSSVVAALIAGVSFATSSSVPGGNQQTGEPILKGQPAFEGFAISSLIGLYFSITALLMFLSILTSRKEIEDFRRNLPMKLLLGLISLFISIVAMLVSFCAGHFFVLTDKYAKGGIWFYLYISICFPVTIYAAMQFPLFVDLVKVIWKKVPPPSVKGVEL